MTTDQRREPVSCPECGRQVWTGNPVACGFLADCGRRLVLLSECRPGGCAAEPIKSHTAQAEALREAVRPFVEYCRLYGDELPDSTVVYAVETIAANRKLTLGDFRALAAFGDPPC